MNRLRIVAALTLLAAIALPAAARPPGGSKDFEAVARKVEAHFEPATAKPGETVTWKLTIELVPGWHTYPSMQLEEEASSSVNAFTFPAPGDVIFVDQLRDPPAPRVKAEPALNVKALHYYEDVAVWERKAVVSPKAARGEKAVTVPLTVQVCDESRCLPPNPLSPTAKLTVAGDAVAVEPKYQAEVEKALGRGAPAPAAPNPPPVAEPPPPEVSADHKAALAGVLDQLHKQKVEANTGLGSFLLTAIFWGAVSLVTPCVFPMIPITVSFFLKQSEKTHHKPLALALVYCATIIAVLGIASLTLLGFFRALSVNPVMNFALGALFVFLALSLFGMFDLTLPSSLTRFTSAREGRGGLIGTVFMALTFTIVSFTCVAPFLGGFGGMASSGQFRWWELVLGALAFSTTFAAPFFVLALFPSLLRKLPKSGGWLNSVKVVMGFLELAAALKFFRAGELILRPVPTLFTFDLVLGMWVALSLLCGLYLINLFRLGHDEPLESVSVPRFLTGFLFISMGLYLLPALFGGGPDGEKQRPGGTVYAWVDSFLLPEPRESKVQGGLAWHGDLKAALDEARAERERTGQRKLVFVDFTGETCTNCKINEKSVFTKGEIKDLFGPYRLVQLFTDKVPDAYYPPAVRAKFKGGTARQRADAGANLWFQREAFGTEQLPLYVILEPLPGGGVEVVGRPYDEGKINNEAAFAEFLRKPLANDAARADAR